MKPAQKFLLSCRQTGEAASRLSDWLDHNPAVLGPGQTSVREDLDGLSARVVALARAAEAMPAVGLVATDASAKCDLLLTLLDPRGPFGIAELGTRPLESAALRGILPADSLAGGCAIVRFGTGEVPPTPRGYSIRIVLLGLIDIAAVVTKAAFTSRFQVARTPSAQEVDALFAGISQRLSPQAIPGLSEADVLELRETLNCLIPDHRTLASLNATCYWATLREIAPHISEKDRRLALSLLWGRDAAFTGLFDKLCDGIERFGHGGEAYCTTDALLGKDAATGRLTHHPHSIIHASTVRTLAETSGATMSVMNRFGQATEVERGVIAALVAELPLHVSAMGLAGLAPADLLDFPVPPAIGHRPDPVRPGSHTAANDDLSAAVEHFARAKAIYLLERACLHHELASLVAVVDCEQEDDTFAPAIGDFVETAQGPTAQARAHVRRGLHIVALRTPDDNSAVVVDEAGEKQLRLLHMLGRTIGAGQDWYEAWTPDRPLSEIHWFTSGNIAAEASVPKHAAGATGALSAGQTRAYPMENGVEGELAAAIRLSCDPRMRQIQLNRALVDIRKRLHACVLRHHASNAPAALADWRRGIAVMIQDRIQYLIGRRRLGHLIRALLPSESDLQAAVELAGLQLLDSGSAQGRGLRRTAPSAAAAGAAQAFAVAIPASADPSHVARLAERVVDHWLCEMRRAARSGRMCRVLKLEPRILHNLVDELQIGAVRLGLAREIAHMFVSTGESTAQTGTPAQGASLSPARLAATSHRLINAYLELLAAPPQRGRSAHERPIRLAAQDGEVAEAGTGQYSYRENNKGGAWRRMDRPTLDQWDVAFGRLVEDNIASSQLVMGRSDKDRELGELIQLFASGPFEVEL